MGRSEKRTLGLRVRSAEGIEWVTVDRPGDRNALDSSTLDALSTHLASAEQSGARAVVYQGNGSEYFIGGADGVEMFRFGPEEARGFSRRIQAVFDRMEAAPMLLIAAVDGLCFGGGLEFALACDLRIASTRSRLGLPEVKLGIIPGGGGTQRLPRAIGMSHATEMILTGRLLSAEEAHAVGLVHRVVVPASLEEEAEAAAARVLRIPRHALAEAKRAVQRSRVLPMDEGLRLEAEGFAACFRDSFFADRVREQLEEGRLSTTKDLDQKGREHGDV